MDPAEDLRLQSIQETLELDARQAEENRENMASNRTQTIAIGASFINAMVFLMAGLLWQLWDQYFVLGVLYFVFMGFGLVFMPIGIISGLLAHKLFYRTAIPVIWVAIAFVLLAHLTVFGWAIVSSQMPE
jgi:hypothetical protein